MHKRHLTPSRKHSLYLLFSCILIWLKCSLWKLMFKLFFIFDYIPTPWLCYFTSHLFFCWKFTYLENLVYDKELVTIIFELEEWWSYLVGIESWTQVLTNHKKIIYFTTIHTMNNSKACWSNLLANYDFEISFWQSSQQGKVDVLSLHWKFELRCGDETYGQQTHCL